MGFLQYVCSTASTFKLLSWTDAEPDQQSLARSHTAQQAEAEFVKNRLEVKTVIAIKAEMKSNKKRCEPANWKQAVKKLTKRHTLVNTSTSLHYSVCPCQRVAWLKTQNFD